MERSFLVISQKDFVKRLEEFIEEFERMDRSVEIVNFNTQWQINILNLSAEIDEFLKNAISNQLNDYRKIFHDATEPEFGIVRFSSTSSEAAINQLKRFKDQIQRKILALDELKSRSGFILITPPKLSNDYAGNFTASDTKDIEARIDEVLETLQRGQDIIYSEIEELKDALKYPKKTFKDILKGKLMNMVLEKMVTYEHVQWFYNKISGDTLQKLIDRQN